MNVFNSFGRSPRESEGAKFERDRQPPKRALVLSNRHARQGKSQAVERAIAYLTAFGLEIVRECPEDPRDLPDVIRKYRNCVDLVVIGGGDGTLNAAVEGLVEVQLPLGILPLGTANDLARTLNIPNAIEAACETIARGRVRYIDLGWVNGKYFFNVASLGLSVDITQKLTKEAKHRWGVLAYAATAFKVLWKARPFRAQIIANGQCIRVKTIQIAVGNGRYYGGGMTVIHDATIDDRRLDLYSLEVKHWWEIIYLFPALWQGRHHRMRGVRTLEGQDIRIETRKHCEINTDGELTTQTPAHFRVIPQILPVLVPYS
ncbi:lipid kinase [Oxynema sp. CENA135]|uniref:lipid kinase n=1 Tax=Oxynema sp. CENA135 TaxID=984206 RepID=UPI00190D2BA7|nr:lipid kinase [Oxynema sp. CENA135]MBK4730255.1 lipid kinase [Oxynema sp. CENA135]